MNVEPSKIAAAFRLLAEAFEGEATFPETPSTETPVQDDSDDSNVVKHPTADLFGSPPAAAQAPETPPEPETPPPPPTKETVVAALQQLGQVKGQTAPVAVLKHFGTTRFSEIPESAYSAVLKMAVEQAHG